MTNGRCCGRWLLTGLDKEKRIAFDSATDNSCDDEINTLKSVTIG